MVLLTLVFFKNKSKNGSLSRITIQNIKNIVKIFDYIYPNQKFDFGLSRKFSKFEEIKFKETFSYKEGIRKKRKKNNIKYIILNFETNEKFEFVGRKEMDEFFKEISKNLPKKSKINYQFLLKENFKYKGFILTKKYRT